MYNYRYVHYIKLLLNVGLFLLVCKLLLSINTFRWTVLCYGMPGEHFSFSRQSFSTTFAICLHF